MSPSEMEQAIALREREIARLTREVETLRLQMPPFLVGQHVRVKTGARRGPAIVQDVDRLERSKAWIVAVTYPSTDDLYTYPAERLELA